MLALFRYFSAFMPPLIARYARLPKTFSVNFIFSPFSTKTGRQFSIFRSPIFPAKSAPPSATSAFSVNSISGAGKCISKTASFSSLPSKILIKRTAVLSIAPFGLMPDARNPFLPRSCTVVKIPLFFIRRLINWSAEPILVREFAKSKLT